MPSKALILGGGGVVGVAWHIGVVCGLREAGVDPADADLIVGTSAGSIIGTQLAAGVPFEDLYAAQLAPSTGAIEGLLTEIDVQSLTTIFQKWAQTTEMTDAIAAEIGAMALLAKTPDEERLFATFKEAGYVPEHWPAKRLLVTTVDAETGRFVTWDRDSGVPLDRAIGSSCAVPGLFPPITINGRRYVDGGVRSGTSADLAKGCDGVVIIAPIGASSEGIGAIARRQIDAEIDALESSGSAVTLLLPDDEALQAFGPNLMDSARTAPAAQAGRRQGAALAEVLRDGWAATTACS
ncbi:MAG: patatin-like phospholipase family protein [Dehalococcoidia bacterium]